MIRATGIPEYDLIIANQIEKINSNVLIYSSWVLCYGSLTHLVEKEEGGAVFLKVVGGRSWCRRLRRLFSCRIPGRLHGRGRR